MSHDSDKVGPCPIHQPMNLPNVDYDMDCTIMKEARTTGKSLCHCYFVALSVLVWLLITF